MPLTDAQVRGLLEAARETHDDELDCEEFLAAMAAYAEARAAGSTLSAALAKAEEHERLCANCREECRALTELVRTELG